MPALPLKRVRVTFSGFGVTNEEQENDLRRDAPLEPGEDKPPAAPVDAQPRRRRRSILGRVLPLLIFVAALPYLLIVLYRVETVHPVSTLMLADLVSGGYDRRWVSFAEISPHVVTAVMMSEDGQFCFHDGVDWDELKGVVDDALEGEATRGASTIAMQTAKNLFLWNSRSVVRKALEIPLALAADFVWPKRRLMEIYLNIAEWGPGIYGIEAAARHHFGLSAAKLSRRQAALLAVSLPNPNARSASRPSRLMTSLAARIERRMGAAGNYIRCLYG